MDRRRVLVASLGLMALGSSWKTAGAPARPKRVIFFVAGEVPSEGGIENSRRTRNSVWTAHGLVPGRDVVETFVYSGNDSERAAGIARELVASRPAIILTNAASQTKFFKQLTRDIPIVFVGISDPVLHGIVRSLGRPGGNITGVSSELFDAQLKLLEIVKEVLPRARRVAWLTGVDPDEDGNDPVWLRIRADMASKAARVGLDLSIIYLAQKLSGDARVQALRGTHADGFIPYSNPLSSSGEVLSIQLASGMPGFFAAGPGPARVGAFLTLGSPFRDMWKLQIAIAVRILRGEDPAAIPVQLDSRVLLAVNMKTARALEIEIPGSILARADEVIQ